MTEGGRKVHLSQHHPLLVYRHGQLGERQTCKSGCSLWPTQQECVESGRNLRSNQIQGIPCCHSYHPPLWLWNIDNFSTAYKETKQVSHDLSEEDSCRHMAKTHPRHQSFNSGFSSQHLHHLDVIIALLGRSCCPHERSLPPKATDLQQSVSGQVLLRRPERVLQRPTESLHEIFWYHH